MREGRAEVFFTSVPSLSGMVWMGLMFQAEHQGRMQRGESPGRVLAFGPGACCVDMRGGPALLGCGLRVYMVAGQVKEEVSPEWSMLGSLGVDGMHVAQYDDGNEVDHTLDEDPMEWLDAGEQTGGGYEGVCGVVAFCSTRARGGTTSYLAMDPYYLSHA
ncbi:hypothetical protein CYMTET_39696 [Cymbomonas tetramitiformis]|uniref:Uncharacterized protein n=1 Tax=Cymbomonas tetramitiformis TaxID=36881 RepID=A0AAE0F3Q1_9CHLO|nr:hypothetical protein CYMTET_39696 [Cymbomonas tetramitiformis]